MTLPRPVVEDDVISITRRTIDRVFLLRPEPELNQAIKYLLAIGTRRHLVLPVAVCFMSDHYHLQAWDVLGQHPAFTQWFHQQLSRFVNHLRGRGHGTVWDPSVSVNVARVVDDEAILDNAAYILANPVAALAVEHGSEWPGVRSTAQAAVHSPEIIERPEFFSSDKPDSIWPASVPLIFVTPPTDAQLDPKTFAGHLGNRVGEQEGQHRARAQRDELKFEGAAAVLARPWTDRASSPEPQPTVNRHPNVIARSTATRVEALHLLAVFRDTYQRALLALPTGVVLRFPRHTWRLKVRFPPAYHPS